MELDTLLVGNKLFAAVCLDKNSNTYYITLKLESNVTPGASYIVPRFYMNKVHYLFIKFRLSSVV